MYRAEIIVPCCMMVWSSTCTFDTYRFMTSHCVSHRPLEPWCDSYSHVPGILAFLRRDSMEYAFRNISLRFLAVFIVLGLLAGTMWAQGGTGELTGLVTDPSGAIISGVQVTLTNAATGDKRTTTTTGAGMHRFSALPVVSAYTLDVTPKGFKGVHVANVQVSVGTVTTRDVKLELGAATETIEVQAGTQLVQTTDAAVSQLIDRRVWEQMPLEARNPNDFIN